MSVGWRWMIDGDEIGDVGAGCEEHRKEGFYHLDLSG